MADEKPRKRQWWERPEPDPPPDPPVDLPAAPVLRATRAPAPAAVSRRGLTEEDVHLFKEGTHYQIYDKLGAHPDTVDGVAGTRFAVWAPNAERVMVIGDWNDWDKTA